MCILVIFKKSYKNRFTVENFYALYDSQRVEDVKAQVEKSLINGNGEWFDGGGGWNASELTINDYTFVELSSQEFSILHKLFKGSYGYVSFGTGAS